MKYRAKPFEVDIRESGTDPKLWIEPVFFFVHESLLCQGYIGKADLDNLFEPVPCATVINSDLPCPTCGAMSHDMAGTALAGNYWCNACRKSFQPANTIEGD